ncbi:MAG: hypothetical protein PQJ50_15125 [Spirochaetales bacterium]|nr:hypothetical protein [Spirochaetales bacterium]
MDYIELNNGIKMPVLGFGVFQVKPDECEKCGVPRADLFITAKVWFEHYGYEKSKESVYRSMEKLKIDYLIFLHQLFCE